MATRPRRDGPGRHSWTARQPEGLTSWLWRRGGHGGCPPQFSPEMVGTCAALHDCHLRRCRRGGSTCHCRPDVVRSGTVPHPTPSTAWIRDVHERACPASALPCPVKTRPRGRWHHTHPGTCPESA